MTCRDVIEFLMDYLSSELPPAERAVFDAHLAECPACISFLHTYQESIRMGRMAFDRLDDPVPSDIPEDLVRAILQARQNIAGQRHQSPD